MDFTPERQQLAQRFLDELRSNGGFVNKAAASVGITRVTAYNWRKADAGFAAAWDDVIDYCVEEMEAECRRRAFVGYEEPIHYKGELVDTVRKFSDTLMIFFLKAHRPEKYREQIRITLGDANQLVDAAITQHQLPAPTSDLLDSAM
jgi:hypothetical protein